MEAERTEFEGWAVIELFGHQKEAGYVRTRWFGGGALFQIDVPKLEEREYTIERPEWVDGNFAPAGSVLKRCAREGRTRFVGVSAIYALNPCTEAAAIAMIDQSISLPKLMVVSLPPAVQLAGPWPREELEEELENDEDV